MKFSSILAVSSALLMLAGCGSDPKIPSDTVVAGYADVSKVVSNVKDVVKDIIGELPKEMRKEAEKSYDGFLKEYGADIKSVGAEWACVTVKKGAISPLGDWACVVKCDTREKLPSLGKSIEEFMPMAFGEKNTTIDGCDVYAHIEHGFGHPFMEYGNCSGCMIACVDGSYVVITSVKRLVTDESKAFMAQMIDLYKNGKGETSDAFGDLTSLDGDTVLRVRSAEAETLVDVFEMREIVDGFARTSGAKDLVDDALDIGNVTLDVKLSDDVFGSVLKVDAGFDDLAEVVEGAFYGYKLLWRTGVAVAACGMLSDFVELGGMVDAEGMRDVSEAMRDAVKVDRSGTDVSISVELDTDDVIEAAVKASFKDRK